MRKERMDSFHELKELGRSLYSQAYDQHQVDHIDRMVELSWTW